MTKEEQIKNLQNQITLINKELQQCDLAPIHRELCRKLEQALNRMVRLKTED